jgi:hypothetical protein
MLGLRVGTRVGAVGRRVGLMDGASVFFRKSADKGKHGSVYVKRRTVTEGGASLGQGRRRDLAPCPLEDSRIGYT